MINIKFFYDFIKEINKNPKGYGEPEHKIFIEKLNKIIEKNSSTYIELKELYENKKINNQVFSLPLYNEILSQLLFLIIKQNPFNFEFLFNEENFSWKLENNELVSYKKIEDNKIIKSAIKNYKIINQEEYLFILNLKTIRNNYSISHIFNFEISDNSLIERGIKLITHLSKKKVKFKLLSVNISSMIQKIKNINYINFITNKNDIIIEFSEIKEAFDTLGKNESKEQILNFLFSNIISSNIGFFNINTIYLELLIKLNNKEKFTSIQFLERIINEITKEGIYENIIIYIINFLMWFDFFHDNEFIETSINYIKKWMIKQGNYYEFKDVNACLECNVMWFKIIEYENSKNSNFILEFYHWIIFGNKTGLIAKSIKNFEYYFHSFNSENKEKIIDYLDSPIQNNAIKKVIDIRKSNIFIPCEFYDNFKREIKEETK
ncbi:MAG: hypothetical protein ACRDAW_02385 [Metamycoplasmataceae bacterium]